MSATVGSNGWLQGGYGLAWAYAALKGTIDTEKMNQANRMVNTKSILITKTTVAAYKKNYITNPPKFDFKNLNYMIDHPMKIAK